MKLLLLFLFIGTCLFTNAQESCSHRHFHKKEQDRNPMFEEFIKQNELKIQNQINFSKGQSLLAEEMLTVPVVVHIMHLGEDLGVGSNISDEQIHSAISKLNADLADAGGLNMNIEFKLASLDPNCQATTGIVRVDASSNADYASDGIALSGAGTDEINIKNMSRWSNSDYYNI